MVTGSSQGTEYGKQDTDTIQMTTSNNKDNVIAAVKEHSNDTRKTNGWCILCTQGAVWM